MQLLKLKFERLSVCRDILTRSGPNEKTVAQYAEAMRKDFIGFCKASPGRVVHDKAAGKFWLVDGEQRTEAAKKIGEDHFLYEVIPGTKEDAVWMAANANLLHGDRSSAGDKKRAVENCFKAGLHEKYVDSVIADQCSVSSSYVTKLRKQYDPAPSESSSAQVVKGKKGGTVLRGGKSKSKQTAEQTEDQASAAAAMKEAKRLESEESDETIQREIFSVSECSKTKDQLGIPVSERLQDVLSEAKRKSKKVNNMLSLFTAEVIAWKDMASGVELDTDGIMLAVTELRKEIESAMFYAGCPECADKIKPSKNCRCGGKGWFTREQYSLCHLSVA